MGANEEMTTTSGKILTVVRDDNGEIKWFEWAYQMSELTENEVFDLYNYITETDEEDDS